MLTLVYDVLKDNELTDFTKLYLIEDFDKVLSLNLIDEKETIDIGEEFETYINEKIAERKLAKQEGDYEKADKIRNELLEKGVMIKDTREGTVIELIK